MDALYGHIALPVAEPRYQDTSGGCGEPLTELPEEAQREELLQRLLQGDITGYTSQSSADFVLVLKLLHWTGGNIELTKQVFLRSGLFREKTDVFDHVHGALPHIDIGGKMQKSLFLIKYGKGAFSLSRVAELRALLKQFSA